MATAMVTKGQVKFIRSVVHGRLGWSNDYYHEWLLDRGGPRSTLKLTRAQAANVIDMLKALAFGSRPPVWHVDQVTERQQTEIERLSREAGLKDDYLAGIVLKATRQRTPRVAELRIWEARDVIDGLKSVISREARRRAG